MSDDFDTWLAEREKDEDSTDDVETLRPGQRVGAYRIIRQLGVGGMGQVYEAEHVALGVRRALKVFSTVSEHSEFLRKRFVAEGRILADLQHPRIVRVYDLVVDEDSGMAYFEMDLVLSPNGQPRTLADELKDGVDEEKIAGWFKDICEGLAYIHSQGVVHRDISLDNILIDGEGRAVITDFGVAKIIDDSYRRKIDVTVTMVYKDGTEVRMGKDRYMAPELKKQGGKVSFASDAWAVGVLLFHMLSGSWYDVGTRLEDWLADLKYDWRPVIAQLCNVDPAKRLCDGGIAALPAMVKRKGLWHGEWGLVGGVVVAALVLTVGVFLKAKSYDVRQRDGGISQENTEESIISGWELVATGMPQLTVGTASSNGANVSQIIARLTESVRSNLWTTTLHSKLGLPENGWQDSDIILTINPDIQFEAENAIKWGLEEYGAAAGWAIVMDAKTGAVYAIVSTPETNRAVGFNYEPGSVMNVLTVACAIDSTGEFVHSNTRYNTNRDDSDYYRLPGDGAHVWEPRMTVKDAILKSSNVVIGKLGYDLGPKRLYAYFRKFGLGEKTGIELPGEEWGILLDPNKRMWDRATWSRAAIGQFVAVTGIQLASAYQAIANDGVRMRPYIIDRIVDSAGTKTLKREPTEVGRAISANTAREMRTMLMDVVSPKGTAPRAAILGYSIAGKTGTAQKRMPGIKGYAPGVYRPTFCGIVPATEPRFVVVVTLDFDHKAKYHQGGNSAGPVFKRISEAAIRCLDVKPDTPGEVSDREQQS